MHHESSSSPAPILTSADIAARWRCAPSTVTRLCAAGELRAFRAGHDGRGGWRITAGALADYERAQGGLEPLDGVDDQLPPVLTPDALADRWHIHPQTLRDLIRRGHVPAFTIGRQLRIAAATVRAFEHPERARAGEPPIAGDADATAGDVAANPYHASCPTCDARADGLAARTLDHPNACSAMTAGDGRGTDQ
jgi:excisionase family DNA binding protein